MRINIRMHLKPGLAKHQLRRLSVPTVQASLNGKIKSGQSVRNVQILRQILSAALSWIAPASLETLACRM
jgi:hypothetical protein